MDRRARQVPIMRRHIKCNKTLTKHMAQRRQQNWMNELISMIPVHTFTLRRSVKSMITLSYRFHCKQTQTWTQFSRAAQTQIEELKYKIFNATCQLLAVVSETGDWSWWETRNISYKNLNSNTPFCLCPYRMHTFAFVLSAQAQEDKGHDRMNWIDRTCTCSFNNNGQMSEIRCWHFLLWLSWFHEPNPLIAHMMIPGQCFIRA